MVRGLRGASKSNGYDHDITHRYGPRDLLWMKMYVSGDQQCGLLPRVRFGAHQLSQV